MLEEQYILIIVAGVCVLIVLILYLCCRRNNAPPYTLTVTNDFYEMTEEEGTANVTHVFHGVIDNYPANDIAISFNRGAEFVHYKLIDSEVSYIDIGSPCIELYVYKNQDQLVIHMSKHPCDEIWKRVPNRLDFKVYSTKNNIIIWNSNNIEIKYKDVLDVHIGFVNDIDLN